MMEWDEISRRLRNGTSVRILADLDGVPYKTMYNRIKYYERRDGKRYMPESKPMKAKGEKITVELPEICQKCHEFVVDRNVRGACAFRKDCPKVNGNDPEKEFLDMLTKGATGPEEIQDSEADPEEIRYTIGPVNPEFLTKPLNIPEAKALPVIPEAIRKEIHEKIVECTRKAAEYTALAEGWQRILQKIETEGKT